MGAMDIVTTVRERSAVASFDLPPANLHESPKAHRKASPRAGTSERDAIAKLLADGVRLSKVQRLLHRRGVDVPYPTRAAGAAGASMDWASMTRRLINI